MLHQIVIRECKGMEMSCIEMDSRYQRDHFGFIAFRRAGILHVISGVSEIMMSPVQYFVQVPLGRGGGGRRKVGVASLLPG